MRKVRLGIIGCGVIGNCHLQAAGPLETVEVVAVADLIPGLVRRHELSATVQQMLLILAGVATIWVVGALLRGTPASAPA